MTHFVSIFWDLDTCPFGDIQAFKETIRTVLVTPYQYIEKHFICWCVNHIIHIDQHPNHTFPRISYESKLDFFQFLISLGLSDGQTAFVPQQLVPCLTVHRTLRDKQGMTYLLITFCHIYGLNSKDSAQTSRNVSTDCEMGSVAGPSRVKTEPFTSIASEVKCDKSNDSEDSTESEGTSIANQVFGNSSSVKPFNQKKPKKKKKKNRKQNKSKIKPTNVRNNYRYKPLTEGVCGLQNMGNTCYMNSGIQCLSNIEFVAPFMKDFEIFNHCGNGYNYEKSLIQLFSELVVELWSAKSSAVWPTSFRRKVSQTFDRFSGYNQNDCSEFLVSILDQFHKELLEMDLTYSGNRTTDVIEFNTFAEYLRQNNTFIAINFYGFQSFKVSCDCGQTIHTNSQSFPIISLPQIDRRDLIILEVSLIRNESQIINKIELRFTKSQILIIQLIRILLQTFHEITSDLLNDNHLIVTNVVDHTIHCVYGKNEILNLNRIAGHIYVYEIDPSFPKHYFISLSEIDRFGTPLLLNVYDSSYATIVTAFAEQLSKCLLNTDCQMYERLKQTKFRYYDRKFDSLYWACDLPYFVSTFIVYSRMSNGFRDYYEEYEEINLRPHNSRACDDRIIKLDDCLNQYLSYDISDEKCSGCQTSTRLNTNIGGKFSNQSYAVQHAPNVLLLQLKSSPGKLYNCEFPIELDLKNYVVNGQTSGKDYMYDLTAVSNYSGSSYCGHYTACAKNYRNQKWYHFNDSYVDEISDKRLQSSEAYVLVYVKRNVK
ncbi:unnamed protein product [Oppiella nova]|uniref:ubiquitinyl hydrolase 1 n=1 Tax=Oppiella nova TaxID=334625 RepID=A0A7R9LHS0_9ACAR|nr:unnamed protein product [Oppiella nova]CAG2163365.1 unnamed protein product [Oppiella nova]